MIKNDVITGNVEGSRIAAAFKKDLRTTDFKPLVYVTWIIENKLFGMNPRIFHLDNLLIHLLNSFLVFLIVEILVKRITPDNKSTLYIAFFTALLFAIHPFKVESVAWAVERKDVLFSLFYFTGILFYLKYLSKGKFFWMWPVALCYLLSCLSKAQGITFIAVIFLLDYFWKREWNQKIFTEKWPMLFPLLIVLAMFGFIGGGTSGFVVSSNVDYAKNDSLVYDPANISSLPELYKLFLLMNFRFWLFLIHFLLPVKMALVYPGFKIIKAAGTTIHLFPILTAGLLFLVIKYFKKFPVFVFAALFSGITLLPVLVLPGTGSNFLSDRYMYLPSFSFIFLISYFIIEKLNSQRMLMTMGVLTLFYFFSAFSRTSVWKNDALIWEDNLAKYGDDVYPLNNLGRYYAKELNNPQKALDYLNRSMAYSPNNMGALLFRGNVYGMLGKDDLSILDFQKASEQSPENIDAMIGLAIGYAKKGRNDLALEYFKKATGIEPENITVLQNLGILYCNMGNYTEAVNTLTKITNPDKVQPIVYYYLAISYFNLSDYDNADKSVDSAIKMDPSEDNYLLKSKILFQSGNKQGAIEIVKYLLSKGFKIDNTYRSLLGI